MKNRERVERAIAELYDHIARIPTAVGAEAPAEVKWRAAAATVQLPRNVRDVLKWYTTAVDADLEVKRKALRLLFDTLHAENIEAAVTEKGEVEFFVDLRGSAWLSAVKAADGWAFEPYAVRAGQSDLQALIELLRAEPISEEGRALVTDLLARHNPIKFRGPQRWTMAVQRGLAGALARDGLGRKRGRQTTPVYARSDIDARLAAAVAEYRALRGFAKLSRDAAAKTSAAQHRLLKRTLLTELDKRRGSTPRKAERRATAFKGGSKTEGKRSKPK